MLIEIMYNTQNFSNWLHIQKYSIKNNEYINAIGENFNKNINMSLVFNQTFDE